MRFSTLTESQVFWQQHLPFTAVDKKSSILNLVKTTKLKNLKLPGSKQIQVLILDLSTGWEYSSVEPRLAPD